MVDLLNELKKKDKMCTGCGACYNVCPVGAVEKIYDAQGFFYPKINFDKCISCNKCINVCPKINPFQGNIEKPDCYAAMANDDVREKSSSGGIFTLIAEEILNQDGVVCGAAMDYDFSVRHICVDKITDLDKLRQSKYVQSDTNNIYKQIEKFLKIGRKVLFSGCPCQVAAARNIFGENDNLFLLDILCHGVPSEKMWKDYIRENFDLNQVKKIEFRSKLNGWRAEQLRVFYNDDTSECVPWPESAYEEGFQRNIALRDGCEYCEFAGYKRQGDLTIGDFWRIENFAVDMYDKKGTSVVLINNTKGEEMFNRIKSKLSKYKKMSIDQAAKFNRLNLKFSAHPLKERFKTLYPKMHDFTNSVMQCRHNLYDIGLVAVYTVANFGGQLTQYALYNTLTELGYSVLMIERPKNSKVRPRMIGAYLFEKNPYPKYAISKYFNNIAEMKFLNLQCNTFITGSDQMFNNLLYNEFAKFQALNFVTDNKRKIAYAASWGHDKIWGPESDRAEESYYLKKFDFFSVREDSAVELAKREFGVDATWVLDPVFLCSMQEYNRMVKIGSKYTPKVPFLFAYILDPDKSKEAVLKNFADSHKLMVRAIVDKSLSFKVKNLNNIWSIDTIANASIESWIAHFANSEFVITDSFHGTCLSIIMHKNFLVLVNKLRGETRFTSLLRLIGLEDRMCYSFEEIDKKLGALKPVDYEKVDKILNLEKERSLSWLQNAINSKMDKKSFTEFDILDGRIDDLMFKLDQRLIALETGKYKRKNGKIDYIKKKIKGGIQCYKDNGMKYTINRVIFKIKRKLF